MRTRWIVGALLLVALAYGGIRILYRAERAVLNVEIAIYIATPEGEARFSEVNVLRLRQDKGAIVVTSARGIHSEVTGEAVVLELGERISLAQITDLRSTLISAYWTGEEIDESSPRRWAKRIRNTEGARSVPENRWPQFYTFDDPTDPITVRQIRAEDFANEFGSGFSVADVTVRAIEVEPQMGSLAAALPWFEDYHEKSLFLDGEKRFSVRVNASLPEKLDTKRFLKGDK